MSLDGNAVSLDFLGGGDGVGDRARKRHQGDIIAVAQDTGAAEGNDVVVLRHFFLVLLQLDILDEQDRVIVPQGCLQQAFGVARAGGYSDLQSRHVHEPGFEALGMLRPMPMRLTIGMRITSGTVN